MKTNISVEITPSQLDTLVDRLPLARKIRLIRRIEKGFSADKLNAAVKKMRERVKKNGISDQDIDRICEEVRKERYAKNQSRT
jgi:hypothetical protein